MHSQRVQVRQQALQVALQALPLAALYQRALCPFPTLLLPPFPEYIYSDLPPSCLYTCCRRAQCPQPDRAVDWSALAAAARALRRVVRDCNMLELVASSSLAAAIRVQLAP